MKNYFNLRKKSKLLLLMLLAVFVGGVSPTWAGTGDTNFDDVTLVNPTLSYGTIYYGTQLSNDWIVQGGSIYNGGYTGNYFLTSSYKRGDSGLAIDASQSGSQTAYLITPAMSGDVTFWFKSTTSSSSSAWQINVYEATENGESFDIGTTDLIPSQIKHSGKGSQTWTQVTLSNVEGKNLAFKFFRVAIDDFEGNLFVETGCKKPKNLSVSNLTVYSADLSWTAGEEGQDTWQVVYSTDANFDKDAATPINVNTTSYSLTGLSDNSTYYVGIRSYCGTEDQSAWVTTNFKTPIAPITSFPWSENFNSLTSANTIPGGWDNSEGTTTDASYKWCYNTSTSGNGATNGKGHEGNCIRFNSYTNSSNNTNFLKTPAMNFTSGKRMQLIFWYKNPAGGDFSVYISKDGGLTYTTELITGLTGKSAWTQQEIVLPDNFTENVVIVFKGTSNYGSGDAYIYLDDVTVQEAPSCIAPTGLTASSVTTNSATLTWTAGGSETSWEISYGTSSTEPAEDGSYTTVNSTSYDLTGLTPQTSYYFFVRAIDGGSHSKWAKVSFTTTEVSVSADDGFADDFETANKWNLINGTLTNAWAWGEATSNGGSKALYISNDGGTTNAYSNSNTMVYATKLFSFDGGTYKFAYDWLCKGESTYDYLRVALIPANVTLTAGEAVPSGLSATALPTGWIALDGGSKLNLSTSWQSKSIELAVESGSYYVVFAWRNDGSTNYNPPAAIDNFSISVQNCPAPTSLAVSDITAHSATLTWATSSNKWEVYCSTESTTPAVDVDVTASNLETNSYTFTGLKGATTYYVWVRSVSGSDKSDWVGKSFTTEATCITPTGFTASSVTANSATLTWTPGGTETEWEIAYSTTSNFDPAVKIDVNTNTATLTGLASGTTYYVKIRSKIDDEYSAWTTQVSFTTLQVAVSADDGFVDDFETANSWSLINGTLTNAWAWGEATSNGGTKALYISNNGGTTNAYTNSSAAMVYATKLFSFEGGTYTFTYDWLCNGESTYDYLRVALVPANVTLTAGTTAPSGFSATGLPTGWIALDGGSKLNLSSSWQSKSVELAVEAGSYYVIFAWRDDTSTGSNPPAAIDNFSISVQNCPAPTSLAVSDITAHSATLTWATSSNKWEVYCSTESTTPAVDVDVTASNLETNSYTFTGLKGATTYYVWVRSVSGSDKSDWVGINFTTEATCISPVELAVSAITDKSATLTWTDDTDGQDTWQVSYSTISGDPNNGTIIKVNAKTAEITGLTAGFTYYAYVRAFCSEDDQSAWSEACSFEPGVLTVNNGTSTNNYVPLYGYNADNSTGIRSQFIIPSTTLSAIANSEISKLVFHSSTSSVGWGNGTFDVYMKEVENTAFENATLVDWASLDKVFSGKLSVTGNKMTIELPEVFEYSGGNLMIGICQTVKGSEGSVAWYGVTTTEYAAIGGYSTSLYRYQFLPKVSFTFSSISDSPKMVLSTDALNFGLVAPDAAEADRQLTFKIQNKGKAEMTGVNVSYSGDAAISVSSVSNATIKAKDDAEYEDITVTVTIDNAAAGDFSGTITVCATDLDDQTIDVSGTVVDAAKMYEDFSRNVLPDFWTTKSIGSNAGSWNFANGYARYITSGQASYLNNYRSALVSPDEMTFTDNEKVKFMVKKDKQYDIYESFLLVQHSSDGTDWTDVVEGAFETANLPDEFEQKEVTIPATAKQIRFVACGVSIDNIYGGKLPSGARFAIDTDGTIQNFDFVEQDATVEKTYTITNNGNVTLNVTIAAPEGFSVSTENLAVEAGKSGQFTVAMNTTTAGAKSGNVELAFTAIGATSFTIPVKGYVADNSKIYVDFAGNELPTGWTKSSFKISNNEVYYNGYVATLTSPAVTVAEGEKLVVYARGLQTSQAQLDVKTSTDNGSTWSAAVKTFTTELRQNTTDYVVLTIDNIEAGNYKLKFTGDYVAISIINGYTYNQEAPALGVTLAGTNITTGYNDNFGAKVKEALKHTYTIKNTGTGTLTGTITSSVPAHFTVSKSEFSLAKDETLDFDLSLVFNDTYEDKASTITIHPTNAGLADIVINATATTKDPNVWEVDFEDGIPAFWTNEGGAWSTSRYNHEGQAGPMSSSDKKLTTPRLYATKDQVLQFEVIDAESSTYFLKAEYSNDLESWTEIETYITSGTKEFTAPADGYYYLRFTGYYTYIDNFVGFKLALPDHIISIAASNIPSSLSSQPTMKVGKSFNATVTVKENRGVDESFTAKLYMGTEVIGTATGSVAANGTETLTIECTPTTSGYIAMHIEVEYAGGTLSTTSTYRSVQALTYLALDETSSEAVVAGTYDNVTLKRKFAKGWNTVCLPFTISDVEEFFGVGAKAYRFDSYNGGLLGFTTTSTLTASYPYVVYVPTAITEDILLTDITIASADNTAFYTYKNSAYFRGTYAPVAAGEWTKNAEDDVIYGVTSAGKIAKAGANASIDGFRAYFDLPAGATARLSFTDEDGTVTVINAVELDKVTNGEVYNLNGQRVESMKKGLYIVDGKKKVVRK